MRDAFGVDRDSISKMSSKDKKYTAISAGGAGAAMGGVLTGMNNAIPAALTAGKPGAIPLSKKKLAASTLAYGSGLGAMKYANDKHWQPKPKKKDIKKAFTMPKMPKMGDVSSFKDVLKLKGTQGTNWAAGHQVTSTSGGGMSSARMGGKIFKPSTVSIKPNPPRVSQAAGSKSSVGGKGTQPTNSITSTGGGLTSKAKLGIGAGAGVGGAGVLASKKRSKKAPTQAYYPNKY